VLVHGLDSSKETWSGVLAELTSRGYPAMALDLRGHGESPFGPPDDFGAETLARDVWDAVAAHGVRGPVVLVGHSMGGRVAMRAAALPEVAREVASRQRQQGAPPYLAAVVIEDMDLRVRQTSEEMSLAPTDAAGRAALTSFTKDDGRHFATFAAAKQALLAFYPGEGKRVDSWEGKRVRPTAAGVWWSDINPAAQHLARDRVLASCDGAEAWDSLAKTAREGARGVPVHVWVADQPGSVCEWKGKGGIEDMAARLPGCAVRKFDGAAHSIHNTAQPEFIAALVAVIADAAKAAAAAAAADSA